MRIVLVHVLARVTSQLLTDLERNVGVAAEVRGGPAVALASVQTGEFGKYVGRFGGRR